MEQTSKIIICDAGPIIHLDELDCLDALNFSEIIIPQTVYREIIKYRKILFSKYEKIKVVNDPFVSKDILESCKIYNLHEGEIMAISLALENKNSILLTDDSAARLFATNSKIQTQGTIGILLRSVRTKVKSPEDIIEVLSNIKTKSTLHITQRLIAEAINAIRASNL